MSSSVERAFSTLFGAPREVLLEEWKGRFVGSGLRLRAGADPDAYANIVETLLDGVFIAALMSDEGPLDGGSALRWARPGSAESRELEQAAAICGAALAAESSSGFDVGAVLCAVRDVVMARALGPAIGELASLFEWINLVALDAFGQAAAMSARERAAQQIEEGTPVFSVTQELAALIWLGSPDLAAAEGIVGRLLLHLVRTGARAAVIDVSRLGEPHAPAVVAAMKMIFTHRKVQGRVALVVVEQDATDGGIYAGLAKEAGIELAVADRFDSAVEQASQRAGAIGPGRR